MRRRLWVTISIVALRGRCSRSASSSAVTRQSGEVASRSPGSRSPRSCIPTGRCASSSTSPTTSPDRSRYGTRPIPLGPYLITDVSVSEHGRRSPTVGAPYNLQWFFDATDEQRTFDVAYTVEPRGRRRPGRGRAVLEVGRRGAPDDRPGQRRALRPAGRRVASARGATVRSNGVVRVGADSVRWNARSVPQGTFVEGRVATPGRALPRDHPDDDRAPPPVDPHPGTAVGRGREPAAARSARRPSSASATRATSSQWLAPLVAASPRSAFLAHLAALGPRAAGADRHRQVLPRAARRSARGRRRAHALGPRPPERVRRDGARPRAARLPHRRADHGRPRASSPTAPSTRSPGPSIRPRP